MVTTNFGTKIDTVPFRHLTSITKFHTLPISAVIKQHMFKKTAVYNMLTVTCSDWHWKQQLIKDDIINWHLGNVVGKYPRMKTWTDSERTQKHSWYSPAAGQANRQTGTQTHIPGRRTRRFDVKQSTVFNTGRLDSSLYRAFNTNTQNKHINKNIENME